MSKKFKIGIDYGGTKIEGILLDEKGLQIERKRYSYGKNYLSGIETVKKLVDEFDKLSDQVMYCSPVSGEIIEVVRGLKRRIEEIRILPDKKNIYIKNKKFSSLEVDQLRKEDIIKSLTSSGVWPHRLRLRRALAFLLLSVSFPLAFL